MFILQPDNRGQPDEVLLDDLRSVFCKMNADVLTRELYAEHGRFSPATIAKRFGGWGRAVERAGLAAARHSTVSAAVALHDLRRVAELLSTASISLPQYRVHGKYSEAPFLNHFGSWVKALTVAGLAPSKHFKQKVTEEALFENLERVWQRLGRQPTVNDMFPPASSYSAHAYKRRFGGWRRALDSFVAATKPDGGTFRKPSTEQTIPGSIPIRLSERSTGKSRSVGWRLRYVVLSRDHFACKACGRSPAAHPAVALEVDHIIPWSRGGETVESNLQTLCEQCNGGKGAG